MLTIRCPVIAGIKGHAIAGGYILSLGADIRIVGNNRSKFGLSEVDLGVAIKIKGIKNFDGGFPTLEEGVRGMKYIEKVVESNAKGNIWLNL